MGSIRRIKTKRRARDLDQIHADLRSTKHLTQFKNSKSLEDLPGLGKYYCVECSKWFEAQNNFDSHLRGKNHKRRARLLKEKPYTQGEADAAVGLRTDNGKFSKSKEQADETSQGADQALPTEMAL